MMLRLVLPILLCVLGGTALGQPRLHQEPPPAITVPSPALYPEGIEFNPLSNEFLLGSIRRGAVVSVAMSGAVRPFVEDQRLRSVVGIRVDAPRGRLLVLNSDYAVAERSAQGESFATAALAVYDLRTGAPLQFIDLSAVRPRERRFVNDLAVDADGNAYITDSLAAAILRVTPAGDASVFLTHERFRGDGFNLNGIQVHPDGFLLVVKKSDGTLFRVPLADPAGFVEVQIPERITGTDGLVLLGPHDLVAIANRTATVAANRLFRLHSEDGWRSARIAQTLPISDTYMSTGIVHDGRVFAVHGWLHVLPETLRAGGALRDQFLIQEIGRSR
jgi:sugar lactone lactonase YvrE